MSNPYNKITSVIKMDTRKGGYGTHRIELPNIVLVGIGILNSLGNVVKELGFKRALIVSGEKTYNIAGKRSLNYLSQHEIVSDHIIVEDANMDTIFKITKKVYDFESDVVLGIGGGRNIDLAKLASYKSQIRFISIPTIASHDGIASSLASIKTTSKPYSIKAKPPVAVLMDSWVIAESPYRYTASGCGDIISKLVEVKDWVLAHRENGDYYGGYASSLSLMSSKLVMDKAAEIRKRTDDGIRTLLEALVSCGVAMSIAGSSRPCSGSSHLFSHSLDIIADNPALHGEQCGVGAIMMAKLHKLNWKEIKAKLELIGAPTTAEDLGLSKENIIEALVKAKKIRPERYTILNKISLNYAKAKALAEETFVI
jgi:glycerol-1-phosphate dehydrogenase [NAD(P)+]